MIGDLEPIKNELEKIVMDIDRRIEELKTVNYYFLASHLREIKDNVLKIISNC